MTVYFIGAGPGAPDLITVRGQKLIARCSVCLYAGSLVPAEVIAGVPEGAIVQDTANMDLDAIITAIETAHEAGHDIARVHSGDPSIFGAMAEQLRRLDLIGIPYEIVPGVPAFAAAAARLGTELTLPGVSQTVILTRVSSGASPMPPREDLATLAQAGATLVLHLAVKSAHDITAALLPYYGADCPAVLVYRATWRDERIVATTLEQLPDIVAREGFTRTALIFVGRVFGAENFRDSALYSRGVAHYKREGE